MSYVSSVTCSGMNNQNPQRLKAIQREDKLNEKFCEEAKKLIEKNREKNGVSYETTISDSVSNGLSYIQSLEKQLNGTKFFVGTVSYGQTYGNSTDTNFVVNPNFLSKLGSDETIRKQFEEDVKFLNDFSKRFREQQLAQGREIINQGWFCDENGNWGGWCVSRPINQNSVLQDMTDYAEIESQSVGGSVGVNVGKTARKIEAAKTKNQLRAVMAEISGDMQEVKAGIEKGWCDKSELEKVNQLMAMAQNKMGQVEDREATPEEETMFALASLM